VSTATGQNEVWVGITANPKPAVVKWESGQGNIDRVRHLAAYIVNADLPQQLRAACEECQRKARAPPTLIVAVIPDGGNDIYTAIKQ
jgi:eukaryotic translation initiation factor 2C